MTELLKVKDLRAQLDDLPDDLPVFLFDLHTDEAYPLQQVDPTISDRVDLNFSSAGKNQMTFNEAVYRLCQEARSSIDEKEHFAKMVANEDQKSSLAEDIGLLREALEVIADSGFGKPESRAYESFIEMVRDRL
jgi:hypothetical protein